MGRMIEENNNNEVVTEDNNTDIVDDIERLEPLVEDAVDYRFKTLKNRWLYANFYPDKEYNCVKGHQENNDRSKALKINKWLKNYDFEEIEGLATAASQFRKYYNRETETVLNFLRACKMVLNIQAGMDRFESYCDVFWDKDSIKEYQESKTEKKKKKIMMGVAAYMNSSLIIRLAKAMDAPIQINYQGYKHQMIEVLRDIAVHGTSQRERVNAADKLLIHLNPNELTSLNLVNVNVDGVQGTGKTIIDSYKEAIQSLAKEKLKLMKEGYDSSEIINADIVYTKSEEEKKE